MSFFHSILSKESSSIEEAKILFDYFNNNQLYQEIISLLDCNIPETIIIILKFLKSYLEMGEFFKEEKGLRENICSIRIWVKEFGLTRIENLTLHTEETIAELSTMICEHYLNDNLEKNIN